jgi:hypothetical protein
MPVPEVNFRRRKLTAAFEKAKKLDAELQADYARLLCVLLSGFFERSLAEIILAYAHERAAPQICAFLEAGLRRLSNVDKGRLLTVIGSLDEGWRLQVDAFVVDERLAALNSIVGLRNDIAHGGGGGVSLLQVEKYWESLQEIVDWVDRLLIPEVGHVPGRPRRGRR